MTSKDHDQKISEINKELSKQLKKISKLLLASEEIKNSPAKEINKIAITTKYFILATLPHSNPGTDLKKYIKKNGNFNLIINSGLYGIPYGSIPRLIIFWLATETKRTQSRKIHIGKSLTEFMFMLGIDQTGGSHGSIARVKDQIRRLFYSSIIFQYDYDNEQSERKGKLWMNFTITKGGSENQAADEEYNAEILLSEEFYNAIVSAPVPLDIRALKALKQSPLALDLYSWLSYRMSYLTKPVTLSWQQLQEQFGQEYSETKEFTRKAKQAIRDIQVVYPELYISYLRGRIQLLPSPPHVPMIEQE